MIPDIEKLKKESNYKELVKALEYNKDSNVRQSAADALDNLGWKADNDKNLASYWASKKEWKKCVEIGDPAKSVLFNIYNHDPDKEVKNAAFETWHLINFRIIITKLNKYKSKKNIRKIIKMLRFKYSSYVRLLSAETLDNFGWKPIENDEVYYWIAKKNWDKCVEIGKPSIKPLVKLLKNDEDEIRISAIQTLAKIGEPAIDLLVAAHRSRNRKVKISSSEALSRINCNNLKSKIDILKSKGKFSGLIKALDYEKDFNVRELAAEALENFGWKPDNIKEELSYLIAKQKWEKCVEFGSEAIDSLIRALYYFKVGRENALTNALAQIGTPALKPLLKILRSDSWNASKRAVDALVMIGVSVDEIIEIWIDLEFSRRSTSAPTAVLKKIGHPAVSPLINILNDWKYSKDTRAKVVRMIGEIGGQRVLDTFVSIIERGDDYEVIEAVIMAIGQIGGTKSVAALIVCLEGGDYFIRKTAALALGMLGDERAIQPLTNLLTDSDGDVSKAAKKALDDIRSKKTSQI